MINKIDNSYEFLFKTCTQTIKDSTRGIHVKLIKLLDFGIGKIGGLLDC